MTYPDQTPILNRIDRALHAVHKRSPAEALAAYRQAALTRTGTAHDCTQSECRAERLSDGSQVWQCRECGSRWSTPAHVEEEDADFWSTVFLVLALAGSLVVLGVGFGLGYVARGWFA